MHNNSQNITHLIYEIACTLKPLFTPAEEHAWWIIEAITGKQKSQLIAHETISLTPEQETKLHSWLNALINEHKPLQYLIGSVPFGNLDIIVKPPTLIPRPETEEWCLNLIDQLHTLHNQKLTVLDLCTGSGCIALALAQALPKSSIYGTDISDKALALANRNKIHNKIPNATFLHSDLFASILEEFTFDLIVSNPPYIAQSEWDNLDLSVTQWEDKQALIAPDNGLAIIESILQTAPRYLACNEEMQKLNIPQIIIEIGHEQGAAVHALMATYNYSNITIKQDLAHKDRIACGRIS